MRGLVLVAGVAALFTTQRAFAQDARPIVVEGEEARVRVQTEPATATLLNRDRVAIASSGRGSVMAKGFQELCSGSCQLKLKAGTYSLALMLDGEQITDTKSVAIPAGDSQLVARHESHSGKRIGGWVLIGTSPVTWLGAGIVIKATRGGEAITGGQLVLTSGLALAQLAVGIVLVATGGDELDFEVVPMLPAAPAVAYREQEPSRQDGLALRWSF